MRRAAKNEDGRIAFPESIAVHLEVALVSISAPRVKIAGGGTHFGRIEIDIDGRSGLVVDKGWTNLEAQIACKEINKNFVGGEVYRYILFLPDKYKHGKFLLFKSIYSFFFISFSAFCCFLC